MKTTMITTTAGAGFTSVLCTIPAHQISIEEDGAPGQEFQVQYPDDAYATTYTYPAGYKIVRTGPGAQGLLRRPPNYCGVGYPATGDIYLKIRASAGIATRFRLTEAENQLV